MVPAWRIWGLATLATASASSRYLVLMMELFSMSVSVVRAPISTPSAMAASVASAQTSSETATQFTRASSPGVAPDSYAMVK